MLTPAQDWLINPAPFKAAIQQTAAEVILSNGLISRTFTTKGAFGTIGFGSFGTELLRSFKPELLLTLDGKAQTVGGFQPPANRAFITSEDLKNLKPLVSDWQFVSATPSQPVAPFDWKRLRHGSPTAWPPKGVALEAVFKNPAGSKLTIRYELYDGIPLIQKSFVFENHSEKSIRVDKFASETLALVEGESNVDKPKEWRKPPLTVITDYMFGGGAPSLNPSAVRWEADPLYTTQVNYEKATPVDLVVGPEVGPSVDVAPAKSFKSFRTFVLAHESDDRERTGLAVRKMYRTLAPWITESPIMLHLTSVDPKVVHTAIDQAAECGFEMIVISFWSGLDMEDSTPENFKKFKEFREYANSKGVELGGYSLLASRRIDDQNDVINAKTGKPGGAIFGNSPCLESKWGQEYFNKIDRFLNETGFQLLEHDGNYPGDFCASTTHPGHRDLEDSQWKQWTKISEFYHNCRAKGVFLNVPDNYFLNGSNKTGMGYRESNWSLPRAQQHIHARQNLFDGTWEKPPTMGWMMTPLVEYQGGGKDATIEPLKDHLDDYGMHLANNFGFGVQSCYRGPRLYDAPQTKSMVQKWVTWFKTHRQILESDVVHIRRADGRNLDGILHVNPALKTKGMALIWNPTEAPITQDVTIPLYYTGLKGSATLRVGEGKPSKLTLDDRHQASVRVNVPARQMVWMTFEKD